MDGLDGLDGMDGLSESAIGHCSGRGVVRTVW